MAVLQDSRDPERVSRAREEMTRSCLDRILPPVNELTVFLLLVTMLLMLAVNPVFRDLVLGFFFGPNPGDGSQVTDLLSRVVPGLFLLILTALVAVVAPWNVFSDRRKLHFETMAMGGFGILVMAFSSIACAFHIIYTMDTSVFLYAVFPLYNLICGGLYLLLYMQGSTVHCFDPVYDVRAGYATGDGLVLICILLLLDRVVQLHWALTLAICTTYAARAETDMHFLFRILSIRRT